MRARSVRTVIPGRPVMDGAGVRLKRTIGGPKLAMLDPFLLLDEFRTEDVTDFGDGFTEHPHRGTETVTYMLDGVLEYADTNGHYGTVGPGGVQWVTAGSGVVHEEVPAEQRGAFRGVQFWINLPKAEKMRRPRIQDISAEEIPELVITDGGRVRVIAGTFRSRFGPVNDVLSDPLFLDVELPPATGLDIPVPSTHTAFAYVLAGQGVFGVTPTSTGKVVARGHCIVMSEGDSFKVLSSTQGARYLIVAARPIGEPTVRYGPIVMNTRDEIFDAIDEYHANTFVREDAEIG